MRVAVTGHHRWWVLGWSGLVASTLLFASLLQVVVIAATNGSIQSEPSPLHLSPASTEPVNGDGDDVRTSPRSADPSATCFCGPRFLASLSVAHPRPIELDRPIESCETSGGRALYVGSNSWIGDPKRAPCPDGGA
jgi:hypothetical protein